MLKLNLQHFAEAGTLVNTTGNYVDAYSGTPESFADKNTLTPTMKTYYDTELLENARAELMHTQFGKKQPLPAHRGKGADTPAADRCGRCRVSSGPADLPSHCGSRGTPSEVCRAGRGTQRNLACSGRGLRVTRR